MKVLTMMCACLSLKGLGVQALAWMECYQAKAWTPVLHN